VRVPRGRVPQVRREVEKTGLSLRVRGLSHSTPAPCSSGAEILLGGEGADAGQTRYDLTTDRASGGQARVTALLTGPGTVVVNAKVKQCGTGGVGRYCDEVNLGEPVEIAVTP
jgi:hypothetical protein